MTHLLVRRAKRQSRSTTTTHQDGGSSNYSNKQRTVVQAFAFCVVFGVGCCVTNMTALLRSSDEQLRFLNRAYDDTPTHLTTTAAVAAAVAAVPPPIPPIESISRERKPVPVWQQHHADTENATTTTRSTTTTTTSTGTLVTQQTNTVTRIECQTHHAEHDPNSGMEEDPKKWVNKTEPSFWIALHKPWFDRMRWNSIMQKGEYYETGITAQFHEILHQVQPKGIVVDVGMNIGWFTLYSRAMGHDVVGFDPNPIMHSRVCSARHYNQWGWDDNDHDKKSNGIGRSGITTFAYGLSDHSGTLNLTTGNNPGASSFHADRLNSKKKKHLLVPVTTLDIVATELGWLQQQQQQQQPHSPVIIHLLKIDTEGYEPWVIGGASQLLLSGLVHNIIVESSSKSDEQLSTMFRRLTQAGYQIHLLSGVIGEAYHPEMIDPTNEELRSGKFFNTDSKYRTFFMNVSCNIWWKYQPFLPR